MVNIGNNGSINFSQLKVGPNVKDLKNLSDKEKQIFMHFAGDDGILQQNEIDDIETAIEDFTLEDDELSAGDARRVMRNLKSGDGSDLKGVKGKDLLSFLKS